MTTAPAAITYPSVVTRETVRIARALAALNGLEVKVGDVESAYRSITAPVKERIWTVLGPEHGEDAGKKALIVCALYGLKSSGAAFRAQLCECMRSLGYKSYLADPDLWMKPEVVGNFKYNSYILCYVDDIMIIHHDANPALDLIDKYMKLKESSVGDPELYLGAKIRKMKMPNRIMAGGSALQNTYRDSQEL